MLKARQANSERKVQKVVKTTYPKPKQESVKIAVGHKTVPQKSNKEKKAELQRILKEKVAQLDAALIKERFILILILYTNISKRRQKCW